MGIYIKNMEKPDNCGECFFETLDAEYKNGEWATFGHCLAKQIETDDCPLEEIDLVRCGECKHLKADGTCDIFADDNIRPSVSDFCSHGERKE